MYEKNSELQQLAGIIKRNVNWSCHSAAGDKIFDVTPVNQKEVVNTFANLVKLVNKPND